jgi:hypothetical protein
MKFYKLENGTDRYLGLEDNVSDHIINQLPELIEAGLIDTSFDATYSHSEFLHHTQPPTPTWKNTLANHAGGFKDGEELESIAHDLGYTYFVWNARVYKITFRNQQLTHSVTDSYEIDLDKRIVDSSDEA